jgi:RNA polymerase-binding transcription factor DksA
MNPELTPEVLTELRTKLESERDRLNASIAALRGDEGTTATPDNDPNLDTQGDEGDSSVDLQEFDENHQEELDLQEDLDDVEHALAKFATQTYGVCEECGEPIPVARLRVIPEARYDIQHEREREEQ